MDIFAGALFCPVYPEIKKGVLALASFGAIWPPRSHQLEMIEAPLNRGLQTYGGLQ